MYASRLSTKEPRRHTKIMMFQTHDPESRTLATGLSSNCSNCTSFLSLLHWQRHAQLCTTPWCGDRSSLSPTSLPYGVRPRSFQTTLEPQSVPEFAVSLIQQLLIKVRLGAPVDLLLVRKGARVAPSALRVCVVFRISGVKNLDRFLMFLACFS